MCLYLVFRTLAVIIALDFILFFKSEEKKIFFIPGTGKARNPNSARDWEDLSFQIRNCDDVAF